MWKLPWKKGENTLIGIHFDGIYAHEGALHSGWFSQHFAMNDVADLAVFSHSAQGALWDEMH